MDFDDLQGQCSALRSDYKETARKLDSHRVEHGC